MWYTFDGAQVAFQVPDAARYWPTDVLRDAPLRLNDASGSELVVTGKGAVWMYAHAAAVAAERAQLARLSYCAPNLDAVVVFDRQGASGLEEDAPWCAWRALDTEGEVVGELRRTRAGGDWPVDRARPTLPAHARGARRVWLTGKGAMWMYARMAAEAVFAGAREVVVFAPDEGEGVTVWPRGGQRLPLPEALAPPPSQTNRMVGVVGDPNSGKSVLSQLLDRARERAAIPGRRFDCDAMAPTPDWYLKMVEADREEEAKCLRKGQKRTWTPDMEREVGRRMGHLRAYHRLTLADLPGGNHSLPVKQRVPPTRAVMMRHVDAFIVLTRASDAGEDIEAEWTRALGACGLAERVAVVLESHSPDAPMACGPIAQDARGVWRGALAGLNRAHLGTPEAEAVVDALAPLLRALVAAPG